MPTLKGTGVSLSYVQCFLYLASSSILVSIFHIHGWILSGQTSYLSIGCLLIVGTAPFFSIMHFLSLSVSISFSFFKIEGQVFEPV